MIFFQATKHHLGAAAERILAAVRAGEAGRAPLVEDVLPIGLSGFADVYEGALSPAGIAEEVRARLAAGGVSSREAFVALLESEGSIRRIGRYLIVQLSDSSRFCLRDLGDAERFVHVHPARTSPHTFRIRATTLKTAILAHYLARLGGRDPLDVEVLREARSWIDLPPLPEAPEAIREAVARFEARFRDLERGPAK